MLRKDSVTQYLAACKYNPGSSVAWLLCQPRNISFPMNYVLKRKAGSVFAEKCESEDRLWVKLRMLENGSDANLIAYNLFSVAAIWSALQESSLNLKPQDIPPCPLRNSATLMSICLKSQSSVYISPQINPSFLPTVRTVYVDANNSSIVGAVLSACVFFGLGIWSWGELELASHHLSGRV